MTRLRLGVGGKVLIAPVVRVVSARAGLTAANPRVMEMGLNCASGMLAAAVGTACRIAQPT